MQQEIEEVVRSFPPRRGSLIQLLQRMQERLGYLPPEAMEAISRHLRIPEATVYGVATFYNQFRFWPPGKHVIRVCMGTACQVRGARIILEHWERRLGISEGETTPDRRFSLERVACVGCCALAPVVVVDGRVEPHVSPTREEGILLQLDREDGVGGDA